MDWERGTFKALGQNKLKFLKNYKINIDLSILTETKRNDKGAEKVGEYIHFYSRVE